MQISLCLPVLILALLELVSARHHHHHHQGSGSKKVHLCGKRLASTITAICEASQEDNCPIDSEQAPFDGNIVMRCCAGQCTISEIRSYCCQVREAEKALEAASARRTKSDYLAEMEDEIRDEQQPARPENAEKPEGPGKKVHLSDKHRYDVFNF
ncbi:unnamed protein product, partial [Mesorhabditis spiculigera]